MTDFETTRSKVTNLIKSDAWSPLNIPLFTGDHEQAQALADKIIAIVREDARRDEHTYLCGHCRDGKDLPKGYECKRCGEVNDR